MGNFRNKAYNYWEMLNMKKLFVTYAAEVWVIKGKYQKILATEIEYWRRCWGLTKRDNVMNEEIREKMVSQQIY